MADTTLENVDKTELKEILKAMPMHRGQGIIPRNVGELLELGRMYAASGMFKDMQSAAQACVKISIGAEFGFSPAQSIMGIHIVQGKPQLSYQMIGAIIKRSAHYDYKVKELTDSLVTIEFFQDGASLGAETFTMADAQRQGTQNTGKYPRNMLLARAMSNGAKFFCPDVFGGMPIYTEGEIPEPSEDPTEPVKGASAVERLAARIKNRAGDVIELDPAAVEDHTAIITDKEPLSDLIGYFGLSDDQSDEIGDKVGDLGYSMQSVLATAKQEGAKGFTDLLRKLAELKAQQSGQGTLVE